MNCPYCIKICKICGEILVANEMNFYKSKKGKYGVQCYCKECSKKSAMTYYYEDKKDNINKANELFNINENKTWNNCPFCIKVCTKCNKILVANETNFRKKSNGKYGLYSTCKECNKKENKEYKQNNKEKVRETERKYKQNNKEKVREWEKKWRENNKDKKREWDKRYQENNKEKIRVRRKEYYESNKEEIRKKQKEYNKKNPHVKFNSDSKRRNRKQLQGNGITREQWLEMMNFFDFKCAYSGEYIGGDSEFRTIDHVIPLDNGGEHDVWNCIPCYANYNYSKHTRNMLEWYQQQEFYSEERLNKIYEWMEYAKNKWENSNK